MKLLVNRYLQCTILYCMFLFYCCCQGLFNFIFSLFLFGFLLKYLYCVFVFLLTCKHNILKSMKYDLASYKCFLLWYKWCQDNFILQFSLLSFPKRFNMNAFIKYMYGSFFQFFAKLAKDIVFIPKVYSFLLRKKTLSRILYWKEWNVESIVVKRVTE